MRADIRHALSSHQPLGCLVSVVVHAVLVVRRSSPLGTVAVATIGSVVLMADGMAYPLTSSANSTAHRSANTAAEAARMQTSSQRYISSHIGGYSRARGLVSGDSP